MKIEDLKVAKSLAQHLLENIKMCEINIADLNKCEVEYNERGNINRSKVEGKERSTEKLTQAFIHGNGLKSHFLPS